MKNLLIRFASSGLLAASLGVGLAHASNSISDTGWHSNNQITNDNHSTATSTNTTTISQNNSNNQSVTGGNVVVKGNTWVGNVSGGSAHNSVSQSNSATVTNPTVVMPHNPSSGNNVISDTGSHSNSQITNDSHSTATSTNTTTISQTNSNNQSVTGGNVIVRGNTHVGNVSGGDVWNSVNQSNSANVGSGSMTWNAGSNGTTNPNNGYSIPNKDHHNYPQYPNNYMGNGAYGTAYTSRYGAADGYNSHGYALTASYHRQPCAQRQDSNQRPCDVISYGTIRPPCYQPCHPVVTPPCHPQRHVCHHQVRHCNHHQNHCNHQRSCYQHQKHACR